MKDFMKLLEPGKLISAVKSTSAALGVAVAIVAPVDKAIHEANLHLTPYTTPNPVVRLYDHASESPLENTYDFLDEWAEDKKKRKEAEQEMKFYHSSLAKNPYEQH
ncbi:MAG: hypothetical protein FWF85_04850 [Clostridiales bacterium]|nr:hypothetical protein [Clostridiales bacterium]MDR2712934.1 hypothetical protein [Clostridiales bacterium]